MRIAPDERPRVVEYLAKDMTPRKRWWFRWRLISDPPVADFFLTVRAGAAAFLVWSFYGAWEAFSAFGSWWYVEWGWGHGLIAMRLDPRYEDRVGSHLIRSILASASGGSWPYAQWIEIPGWLVAGVLGAMLVMVWRWTRLRRRVWRSWRERAVGAIAWISLIVMVAVIELVLLLAVSMA